MKNPRSSQNGGYYDATKKPAGNTKDDVIDYNELYKLNCVETATGFEMDYMGAILFTMEPAKKK